MPEIPSVRLDGVAARTKDGAPVQCWLWDNADAPSIYAGGVEIALDALLTWLQHNRPHLLPETFGG